MDEKKKVWIRGRKGCGKEIVKILEELGAKPTVSSCDYNNYVYFISHDDEIYCAPIGSEKAAIVMDNYKEIKLPRQEWKDGDMLICDKCPGQCAVFKKYREDGVFETYLTFDDDGISFNATAPVELYHLASGKELEDAAKISITLARKMFVVSNKLEKK